MICAAVIFAAIVAGLVAFMIGEARGQIDG